MANLPRTAAALRLIDHDGFQELELVGRNVREHIVERNAPEFRPIDQQPTLNTRFRSGEVSDI